MKSYQVEKYVDIIENAMDYPLAKLVTVCKRIDNNKECMFINHSCGTYLPVKPARVLEMIEKLSKRVKLVESSKVVVIGLGNTTVSQLLASRLPQCVFRTELTKKKVDGETPLLELESGESLYCRERVLGEVDTLVFVVDELVTGDKVFNIIKHIEDMGYSFNVIIATPFNWLSVEAESKFTDKNINIFSLVKGRIKNTHAKVEVAVTRLHNVKYASKPRTSIYNVECEEFNFRRERLGGKPISNLGDNLEKVLDNISISKNSNVLVLGTEDFTCAGILVGNYLNKERDVRVKCQASSEISIQDVAVSNYTVNEKARVVSAYDENRLSYLYNTFCHLHEYTDIIVVTDVLPTQAYIDDVEKIFQDATVHILRLRGTES